MITYIKKDVTTVDSGIVIHGVNCKGVMGSGVALAIRNKWPQVYTQYKQACDANVDHMEAMLGESHYVLIHHGKNGEPLYVGNVFTQLNYGKDGKVYANLEAVKHGILTTIDFANAIGAPIYMPRIGCGLGGLDWDDIDVWLEEEDVAEGCGWGIYVCDL